MWSPRRARPEPVGCLAVPVVLGAAFLDAAFLDVAFLDVVFVVADFFAGMVGLPRADGSAHPTPVRRGPGRSAPSGRATR